jgi:hypothetical protein
VFQKGAVPAPLVAAVMLLMLKIQKGKRSILRLFTLMCDFLPLIQIIKKVIIAT